MKIVSLLFRPNITKFQLRFHFDYIWRGPSVIRVLTVRSATAKSAEANKKKKHASV